MCAVEEDDEGNRPSQVAEEHKHRVGVNLAGLRYHDKVFADAALPTEGPAPSLLQPKSFKLGKRKDVTIF